MTSTLFFSLLGSALLAVLLCAKATVAFLPTRPFMSPNFHTTLCRASSKNPSDMTNRELQVANVEAAQASVEAAKEANNIAMEKADAANAIAVVAIVVANGIAVVVPLVIAFVASDKMDKMQASNEIFQLELKKLDTDNQEKKAEIQGLIDAKKGATAMSLSRPSELNDGAVAWLKKQTVAEQGSSLPWLT